MLKIRQLEARDKEVYFSLASAFYKSDAVIHPVPVKNIEATFNEMMRSRDYIDCYLGFEDEKAVGFFLIAKTFSQEAGGMVIWVEEIYIYEQFRGKGYGRELMKYIETLFPAPRYRLEIEPDNDKARKLYNKLGYKFLPYEQMLKGI